MPKLKSAVNSFLLTKKRLKRKTHKRRKTNRRYKIRGGMRGFTSMFGKAKEKPTTSNKERKPEASGGISTSGDISTSGGISTSGASKNSQGQVTLKSIGKNGQNLNVFIKK